MTTKSTPQKAKFKKTKIALIATGLVALASAPVTAGKYRSYDNQTIDYAKVVNVEPIYETYQVNNPIEHCYDERVPVDERRRYSSHDSKTPEIIGGIIGGAIGNRIGKKGGGKARDVATVVGAVLGGSVARDMKHKNRRYHDVYDDRYVTYETVQRCEVRDSYSTEKQLVGYDVSYKYRGNVFHTQMDERPGDRIRVKVSVDPV